MNEKLQYSINLYFLYLPRNTIGEIIHETFLLYGFGMTLIESIDDAKNVFKLAKQHASCILNGKRAQSKLMPT